MGELVCVKRRRGCYLPLSTQLKPLHTAAHSNRLLLLSPTHPPTHPPTYLLFTRKVKDDIIPRPIFCLRKENRRF